MEMIWSRRSSRRPLDFPYYLSGLAFQSRHRDQILVESGFVVIKVILYTVPENEQGMIHDVQQFVDAGDQRGRVFP